LIVEKKNVLSLKHLTRQAKKQLRSVLLIDFQLVNEEMSF
jgi:hypothetical protein